MQISSIIDRPPQFLPIEPPPANSLVSAISLVQEADSLTPNVFDALQYLAFVYAEAIERHVTALQNLLRQPSTPLRDAGVWSAVDAISDYMQRPDSFPYPLDANATDDDLIREAIDVLQDALDWRLDRNMQIPKVREALRFLMWKDNRAWQYINFWSALTFHQDDASWQGGETALKNIRQAFSYPA